MCALIVGAVIALLAFWALLGAMAGGGVGLELWTFLLAIVPATFGAGAGAGSTRSPHPFWVGVLGALAVQLRYGTSWPQTFGAAVALALAARLWAGLWRLAWGRGRR